MKRDLEFVRELLITFSEVKGKTGFSNSNQDDLKYAYHMEILREAGLISYKESKHKSGMILMVPPQLTWTGNDYLDTISNEVSG